MFKTFAASLLAAVALARGTDSGNSQVNAPDVALVDVNEVVTLTLYPYNQYEAAAEFHGDLNMNAGTLTFAADEAFSYGFCMRRPAAADSQTTNNWDCLKADVVIKTPAQIEANPTLGQAVTLNDSYKEGDLGTSANFSTTSDIDKNVQQDKNFTPIAGKNKMECTLEGSDLTCQNLNAHFKRDFVTVDPAGQDIQFSDADVDVEFDFVGFYIKGGSTTWMSPTTSPAVFQAYIDDKNAAAETDDDEDDNTDETEGDDKKKDGATAVTSYAAVLLASIYALAF